MKLSDKVIIFFGLLCIPLIFLFAKTAGDRFIGVMVVVGTTAAVLATAHTVPRSPQLTVEYRNMKADGQPVLWIDTTSDVLVVLVNRGGEAAGIRVRFDQVGAEIYNESGNFVNRDHIDPTMQPALFDGKHLVLGRGEFVIARLHLRSGLRDNPNWTPPEIARWEAQARGMERRSGTVNFDRRRSS